MFPFDGINETEVIANLRKWESQVADAVKKYAPGTAHKAKFSNKPALDMLPFSQRNEFIRKYREIIHLDEVLERITPGMTGSIENRAAAVFASPHMSVRRAMGSTIGQPYANFNLNSSDGFLGNLYSRINLQYKERAGTVFQQFRLPVANIGTVDSLVTSQKTIDRVMKRSERGLGIIPAGKTFTTWDIETAGIMKGHIREIAFQNAHLTKAGNIVRHGETSQVNLRSSAFARGMMADSKGSAVPLEEGMHQRFGIKYKSKRFNNGDDYLDAINPLLEHFENTDFIVGHNINRFDIDQVFSGIAGTSRYLNDKAFSGRIDKLYESMGSKIIDTLELARSMPNLRDIVSATPSGTSFSIENILLQTDFLQRAPELRELIQKGGLHTAAVDLAVNQRLFQLLPHLKTTDFPAASDPIRRIIGRFGAITPLTNIRDSTMLTKESIDLLISHGGIIADDQNSKFAHALKNIAGRRGVGKKGTKADIALVHRAIAAGQPATYKMNFLEQEIMRTRRLGLGAGRIGVLTDNKILTNIGTMDRFFGRNAPYKGRLQKTGRFMKRTTTHPPTEAEFAAFQDRLVDAGLPYAGLSYEERKLGYSLSHMTAAMAGTGKMGRDASLMSDTLISHFAGFNPHNVEYLQRSGLTASMPMSVLQASGVVQKDLMSTANPSMLRLSPFEYGDGRKAVNLVYDFRGNQNNLNQVTDFLRSTVSKSDQEIAEILGIDPIIGKGAIKKFRENTSGLIEHFNKNGLKYGVSVGQLHDQEIASNVHGLLSDFHGGILRDNELIEMSVPFISSSITNEGGESVIKVGATVHSRFLGSEGLSDLLSRTRQAVAYSDTASKELESTGFAAAARTIKSSTAGEEGIHTILKYYDMYNSKVKPNLGKGLIGTAIGLAAFGIWHGHEKQKKFQETMEPMDYENSSNHYQIQQFVADNIASGQGSYGQKMDPLATAYLTSDLFAQRTNHTSMSTTKNSGLYAGVL